MDNQQSLENMITALRQKGAAGTGNLIGQLARMVKPGDKTNIVVEPGDFVKSLTGAGKPLAVSAPLAYDLWYLHNHVNLLTWMDEGASVEEYVSERLAFIREKLASDGNVIYPMKGLTSTNQLYHMKAFPEWVNEAKYFVQLLAFEIRVKGRAIQWDTNRTHFIQVHKDINVNGVPMKMKATVTEQLPLEDFVGYLTFPIGQIGVMEQIAFFQENWSDAEGHPQYRPDAEEKVFNPRPTQLFPPEESANTHCYGDYLVEGYKRSEDQYYGQQLEIDCAGIPAPFYGGKDVKPKGWLRLWIMRDDVFPAPGEFIGILCKPYPVPVHCWWFQESNPFLYAGNWVETGNLSSGIVKSVTLEADRTDGGVGDEYKILYRGIEITVYASDFHRYEVGERVAVLKVRSTAKKAERAFNFWDQKQYGEPAKGSASKDYMILPFTYFHEE